MSGDFFWLAQAMQHQGKAGHIANFRHVVPRPRSLAAKDTRQSSTAVVGAIHPVAISVDSWAGTYQPVLQLTATPAIDSPVV